MSGHGSGGTGRREYLHLFHIILASSSSFKHVEMHSKETSCCGIQNQRQSPVFVLLQDSIHKTGGLYSNTLYRLRLIQPSTFTTKHTGTLECTHQAGIFRASLQIIQGSCELGLESCEIISLMPALLLSVYASFILHTRYSEQHRDE